MALMDLSWRGRDPEEIVQGLIVATGLAAFVMVFLAIWTSEVRWGESAVWMFAVCGFLALCLRYLRTRDTK